MSEISKPLLSLIIPAWNEEQRLPVTLEKIVAFVAEQTYPIEVLIVNNNSRDATRAVAEAAAAEHAYIRVLDEFAQGKGAAVRTGMLAARGEYLFIADADLSMPIEEVGKFLPSALGRYDVAIGSREVAGAVRYNEPAYRHAMGRVFNLIVSVLAVPGFKDTQCGFKCFRRAVALDLFSRQTIDGWAFDVEVLYLALERGYKVQEVPIHWYYQDDSRVDPIKDSINMVREVLGIRYQGLLRKYGRRSALETDPMSPVDASYST